MQVNRPCLHTRWDMKQLKVLLLNIGSWQFAWVFMHVYHPKQGTESRRFYSKYRYKIDAANKHFYWVFSVLFCFIVGQNFCTGLTQWQNPEEEARKIRKFSQFVFMPGIKLKVFFNFIQSHKILSQTGAKTRTLKAWKHLKLETQLWLAVFYFM